MCHLVMHRVGRLDAADHDVTLTTLLDYLPRSNNPNCSAGFAHGLISTLGPAVAAAGPQAAAVCRRGETREQEYTCVHGLGHAFMRNYSESIPDALRGCDSLGPRFAPDCGMGVFHDYWLSLSGLDETERPKDVELSPRALCAKQPQRFVRVCWYPAFLIRPPVSPIGDPADVDRLCSGLRGDSAFWLRHRRLCREQRRAERRPRHLPLLPRNRRGGVRPRRGSRDARSETRRCAGRARQPLLGVPTG